MDYEYCVITVDWGHHTYDAYIMDNRDGTFRQVGYYADNTDAAHGAVMALVMAGHTVARVYIDLREEDDN